MENLAHFLARSLRAQYFVSRTSTHGGGDGGGVGGALGLSGSDGEGGGDGGGEGGGGALDGGGGGGGGGDGGGVHALHVAGQMACTFTLSHCPFFNFLAQ